MPPAPDRDPDPDDLDPGDVRNTQPPDARPFVVALIGFVIVAVAAFFFLKEDDDLTIVRPERVAVLDDTTIRFSVAVPSSCGVVDRAQVDVSDSERVFVEAIVDLSACAGGDQTDDLTQLTVTLPQPVDDRQVVPGVGRVELPCDPSGRCGPEQ